MQGNRVNSWLLVVESQIANSTFSPSFGHNLCFRCPNGWCEPMLNIYVPRAFPWYKELFKPLNFDPCNFPLKIRESTGTPTPNVGVPLGVWGSITSHSLALPGACGMIPGLPSWLATLQPLALVANPRLELWHLHYFLKLLVPSAKVLRSRIDEREVDVKPIEGGKQVKEKASLKKIKVKTSCQSQNA